jgi:hypothetical protein
MVKVAAFARLAEAGRRPGGVVVAMSVALLLNSGSSQAEDGK